MSKRIGLIVDGDGDYASLRRRFQEGFKIVKTDGPRGHSATPAQIANKSRKQILILRAFKCDAVIIVLDFEARAIPYQQFCSSLEDEMNRLGMPFPVLFAVPNQMIENWYLSDIVHLSKQKSFRREVLKQKPYEGRNGKELIKRVMKKGISYSETKHGPELFEIVRWEVARQNSTSFNSFITEIENQLK